MEAKHTDWDKECELLKAWLKQHINYYHRSLTVVDEAYNMYQNKIPTYDDFKMARALFGY